MTRQIIVVIGDCNSIFVKNYITLVEKEFSKVIVLSENPIKEVYKEFYSRERVVTEPYYTKASLWLKAIPFFRAKLGAFLWAKRISKKYGHIDVVHVHALNRARGTMAAYLRRVTGNIIISVWGSELLGKNNTQLKEMTPYYEIANHITFENKKMINCFKEAYGNKYDNKISECVITSGILDHIDDMRLLYTKEEMSCNMGYPSNNKLNVYVGHNGRDVQRHYEITELLKLLPEDVKNKINLVYTMTYGAPSKQYIEKLKEKAKEVGCDVTFITGYKNEDEIAQIRLLCDVLLHAQVKDAASASVRECMYSGAIVVNGDWMPYDNIPNYKNRVIEFSAMDQLIDILSDIVRNEQKYRKRFENNLYDRTIIPSSEDEKQKWINIFN